MNDKRDRFGLCNLISDMAGYKVLMFVTPEPCHCDITAELAAVQSIDKMDLGIGECDADIRAAETIIS